MQTNEVQYPEEQNRTPSVSPGNYSPVTVYMEDTIGAVFLGIIAFLFLIGWLCSEARLHKLTFRQWMTDRNR